MAACRLCGGCQAPTRWWQERWTSKSLQLDALCGNGCAEIGSRRAGASSRNLLVSAEACCPLRALRRDCSCNVPDK